MIMENDKHEETLNGHFNGEYDDYDDMFLAALAAPYLLQVVTDQHFRFLTRRMTVKT